jgi:hypothetical protein
VGIGAQRYECCGQRRLDSERENERSCFERRVLSRLTPELRRSRRRNELKRRDDDRVLAVRRGHATSHFLSDQRGRAGRDVRAAVLRGDTWCASRVLLLARTSRRGVRMAPDGAQQRGVWPHRKCQHDRKDSCSEHVDAHTVSGKTQAKLRRPVKRKSRTVLLGAHPAEHVGCGISPAGAENSAVPGTGPGAGVMRQTVLR